MSTINIASEPLENGDTFQKKDAHKTEENSPASSSPKKKVCVAGFMSVVPSSPKSVQKGPSRRCRHWAKGMCKLGDSCTFLHSGVAGVHVPCRHFVRTGSCSRGDLCDFKHEALGYGVGLYQLHAGVGLYQLHAVNLPPSAYLGGLRPDFAPRGAVFPTPVFAQTAPQMRAEAARVASFGPVNIHISQPTNKRASVKCRHWENGSCRLGKVCGFQHDPNVPQVDPIKGTKVCRHWAKGNCRLEACGFYHNSL